ncbi:hypothetical protein [Bacillus cereus]|uniref:hypothetical protein n=1 Tax=Bacillus cereus TaxID=1396 RepID=UPI000BEC7709|nr:hypothetical protein [Bacillus cereus]PEE94748.1 hypothetical protein COM92_10890 [Bacillus cereus]PGN70862.1 hypothetical protein CN967_27585 [Bacillus cereus]
MEDKSVVLQIIDANNNQEYRITSCTPSEAAYWVGCKRFKLVGYEGEFESALTTVLEAQGASPIYNKVQIMVVPVFT